MVILFGNRLQDKVIEDIERRLTQKGLEVTCVRRNSKHGVMDVIRNGVDGKDVDIVFIAEFEMRSGEYTAEEYVYMRYRKDIKVMPLLNKPKRYKTEYMQILLQNGIYNAVYSEKLSIPEIVQIMLNGRTYRSAKNYYGL